MNDVISLLSLTFYMFIAESDKKKQDHFPESLILLLFYFKYKNSKLDMN